MHLSHVPQTMQLHATAVVDIHKLLLCHSKHHLIVQVPGGTTWQAHDRNVQSCT